MHPIRRFLIFIFLIVIPHLSACNFQTAPSPTKASTKSIPSSVLTEVSATLLANLSPTAIENASPLSTTTLTKPDEVIGSATPTLLIITNSTSTSRPIPTSTPVPTRTSSPTLTSTPSQPAPTSTISPSITATRRVTPGTHFTVDNINISSFCSGSLWIIFTIFNNGTSDLESLALSLYDITAKMNLILPEPDNYPFMPDDHTCSAGSLDNLASGKIGFIGVALDSVNLSNHTLSATIEMCNGEGLYEPCYQKIINFIVP